VITPADGGGRGTPSAAPDDLHSRLLQIESAVDEGGYRPGPFQRLVADAKRRPPAERAALADDLSRVSRKLHLRAGRRTVSFAAGVGIELAVAIAGGVLIAAGAIALLPIAALAGALLWMVAYQPLLKIAVGRALGVGYEYTFLFHSEPRFKMRFGTYIAAPRWARIVLHLSGMAGSPLGLWLAAAIVEERLPGTARVCMVAFWLVVALNVVLFGAGVMGVRRSATVRAADSSGGAAGLELREALRG
jgi:hypothetical protein